MIVGYKLNQVGTSNVIAEWGGVWGSCPAVPNPIKLPNGDDVHSPEVGVNYNGYRLVAWVLEEPLATLETIAAAKVRMSQLTDALATSVTGSVPDTERASWPTKEIAARAVLASAATPIQTAMIQAEATVTGENLLALAAKIVANADSYIAIAGLLVGKRRLAHAQLDAVVLGSVTVSDIDAIVESARQSATSALAQMLAQGQ